MNITIDCRMFGSSGIGVYLEGCLPCFLDSANNFLLLGKKEKIIPLVEGRNNFIIEECNIKAFSFRELFAFPKFLLKKINQQDIYYSPYFNIPNGIKVPVFLTIHDILFPDMPELFSLPGLKARMFFYHKAASRASTIFTVSDFSKSRIEHYLGTKTPVVNASNAVKTIDKKSARSVVTKKKNILFIGNIKKHKGLKILIDAFLDCKKEGLDYQLVIVGTKDNFRSADRESAEIVQNLEDNGITFTGFIPESEKWRLLAESTLLVQPSLYEGFGYPPLEAMLSGTPALISDIPVFREVYGEFPVTFFESGNSKDLKTKMMEIMYNKKPEPLIFPASLRNRYSFEKTVTIILNEFNNHLRGKNNT